MWALTRTSSFGQFDLDVDVESSASVTAVIGPNGSGKSTFLRSFLSTVPQSITVGGRALEDVALEKRGVGYVSQDGGLFPHLSVLENVVFGLRHTQRKSDRKEQHRRAREILERLDCEDLSDRSVSKLSGGERQRVALARALVIEPDILLLDEPLSALDVLARSKFRLFLAEILKERDQPTILVTHDPKTVLELAEHIIVLSDGSVDANGALEEVATRDRPFIRAFFDSVVLKA